MFWKARTGSHRAGKQYSNAECPVSFQLKTQLTDTLSKLEAEENERQKVAGDLYKVRAVIRIYYISDKGQRAGHKANFCPVT